MPRPPLPLSGAAVLELMAERLVSLDLLTGDAATGATARDSVGKNKLSYTKAYGDLTGIASHTRHTSSAMLHLDSQDCGPSGRAPSSPRTDAGGHCAEVLIPAAVPAAVAA